MLDSTKTKLYVCEDFQPDWSLPKYAKPTSDSAKGGSGVTLITSSFSGELGDSGSDEKSADGFDGPPQFWVSSMRSASSLLRVAPRPPTFLEKLAFWRKPKVPSEPPPKMSVLDFFSSVKNSEQELVIVQERAAGYEQALRNAKKCGQAALYEQLQAGLAATRAEAQLIALGLRRYVREEDIVRFYKESPKGLRLDWVRNFTRAIPQDLIDTKTKLDEIGVFDNYVVMHYDPEAKSFAETEAEKEARKDPILFGMMKGRRMLYVVGDWVDEFCDLTLDQLADTIGREAIRTIA